MIDSAEATALAAIRARTAQVPNVAIVIGSGLGALADQIESADKIPYPEIPGWAASTVVGHVGELVIGSLGGKTVAAMRGRLHYYEGHEMSAVAFPIDVFRAWGIRTIVLTNACGGLNPEFKVGDLMLINDHINFMGANPLRGPNDLSIGPRFPDLLGAYSAELRGLAHEVDGDLREGVYVAVAGPNFETPAELRMLRAWGADAVGMSTVPEVLVARHAGMRILAISTVTDMALGDPAHSQSVSHEDVLSAASAASDRLTRLVTGVVSRL